MIAGTVGATRGHSLAEVDDEHVAGLQPDPLVVEPGERHTFFQSSHDYLHSVVQAPFTPGDKVSEPS
jgi:hypothetical protein